MTRAQRLLVVLGSVALMLGVLLLAQRFGLGDGFSVEPLAKADRKLPPVPESRRNAGLKPITAYAELLQRPLFNEDRKPTPIEEEVTEAPQAAIASLDAQLTGVILMPKVKLAMIRETATGNALRVHVGRELDGALAGWKLVELEPRQATFEAEGKNRQVLELVVDRAGAPAAPPPPPPAVIGGPATPRGVPQPGMAPPQAGLLPEGKGQPPNPGAAQPVPPVQGQPAEPTDASAVEAEQPEVAESIRRRIEERRRQLREEAARLMQQQPQN